MALPMENDVDDMAIADIKSRMGKTVRFLRDRDLGECDLKEINYKIIHNMQFPLSYCREDGQLRQQLCDYFVTLAAGFELTKLLKFLHERRSSSNTYVSHGIKVIYTVCLEYSECSDMVCDQFGQCGLLDMLLEDLSGQRVADDTETEIRRAAMRVLYSCAKSPGNKDIYRNSGTIDKMSSLIGDRDISLALLALLTLSYNVDERQTCLLEANRELIERILCTLQDSLSRSDLKGYLDGYGLFSALELVRGLGNIALNDANKVMIVNQGGVNLLVDLMGKDLPIAQECAANTIGILNQLECNKKKIAAVSGCRRILSALRKSENKRESSPSDKQTSKLGDTQLKSQVEKTPRKGVHSKKRERSASSVDVMHRMKQTIEFLKRDGHVDTDTAMAKIEEDIKRPFKDTDDEQLLQQYADHLSDLNGGYQLTKLLRRIQEIGDREPTRSSATLLCDIHFVCSRYSKYSPKLCNQFGQSGLLEFVLQNLDQSKQGKSLNKKKRELIELIFDILRNCAKSPENKHIYHRDDIRAIERISYYLTVDDTDLALKAMLLLSDIAHEHKNSQPIVDKTLIKYTLRILKIAIHGPNLKAHSREKDCTLSALELVTGLFRIAQNDENKETIIKQKAIPLLVELMGKTLPTGQGCIRQVAEKILRLLEELDIGSFEMLSFDELRCPYSNLCRRFKKSVNIPDNFFYKKFDMCYCRSCHEGRGDMLSYTRGEPAKVYGVPTGWYRFGLKTPPRADSLDIFRTWHVAYHGTTIDAIKPILETGDLLMPGDVVMGGHKLAERPGHFDEANAPEGFDTKQIFLSPSIRYSGCDVYAKSTDFKDNVTHASYQARVVFQVRINPASYNVGQQTIGAQSEIDPIFSNQEIEWFTKERGCVVLYGLLVKLEEKMTRRATVR